MIAANVKILLSIAPTGGRSRVLHYVPEENGKRMYYRCTIGASAQIPLMRVMILDVHRVFWATKNRVVSVTRCPVSIFADTLNIPITYTDLQSSHE